LGQSFEKWPPGRNASPAEMILKSDPVGHPGDGIVKALASVKNFGKLLGGRETTLRQQIVRRRHPQKWTLTPRKIRVHLDEQAIRRLIRIEEPAGLTSSRIILAFKFSSAAKNKL
jgi:hypothetical protein